jgi:hypothetical protein
MTQPEPLRLAHLLETHNTRDVQLKSADCLRRLHEVNQALLDACIEATSLFDNYPQCFEAIGTYEVLNQAIAKATGESK